MAQLQPTVTYRKIFIFWLPLAATWLMMALEGPFLTAIIARLNDPKQNLAAFGVAFAFALIIESPVIMLLSASTALVRNRQAFLQMRRFTFALGGAVTLLMLLVLTPPVFDFLTRRLIGLPPEVASLTHGAVLLLLPWPGAIGYRRFYQGVLIRNRLTRRVAYGTVVRLTTMALTGLVLYFFSRISGAYLAAAALSAGVTMEAVASRVMARGIVRQIIAGEKSDDRSTHPLTYGYIFHFYYPLALTSLIFLAVHPMVTFFIGRSRCALESLAVLPVVNSLCFIFKCFGISYQELGVALLGEEYENLKPLRAFAWMLGAATALALAVIAFTPLSEIWFRQVSGLSLEMTAYTLLPIQILAIMPGLETLLSFQRAIQVNARKNAPITMAAVAEVGGIILLLIVAIGSVDMVGATAAACAYLFGRLVAHAVLARPNINALQEAKHLA